jgi:outer membrane immunogenic protein
MHKVALKLAGLTLAGGLAIAAATPAMAQDASANASVDAPAKAFEGPTVSASVGWDHLRSGSTNDLDGSRTKQSLDGVTYGGGLGYDKAVTIHVTLGAEAELTGSSAKWDNNNGVANTFSLGRVKAGRDIYVGARAGYAISPTTQLYVKGGYTNARFNLLASDGTTINYARLDTDGYRLGAGVEHKFTGNAFGRVEYRYSNYSKGEFDYNGNAADSARFGIDTDRHQVMATVGYRF